ncbi:adenylosuccinate synthetase, putative [Pediculus humanus corporis]|uniref:Adenylosuccinate synthetase n=1 Tax=Pediculus humanus subsp. corporis TaxID=121224 RepID=E0VIY2_PEDHC|nr:adenylosuccinate synthetase, putative [Pediculus humanus corporis]EEB13338.1 adenylosuccinate synthetase, putative [Pediculus humanus corporis]
MQELEKGKASLGTTKKGIGPTYSSKATRNGLRVADLLGNFALFSEKFRGLVQMYQRMFPELEVNVEEELLRYKNFAQGIRPYVTETVSYLHNALKSGKRVLVEGANAAMLDIDFDLITNFINTNNLSGEFLQTKGGEIGVTTKRKRRCGWLDLVLLKFTTMVNGYTALCVTKLDILDGLREIKLAVSYKINGKELNHFPSSAEELSRVEVEYITVPGWQSSTEEIKKFENLPINAQKYVEKIEEIVNVKEKKKVPNACP